MSRAFAVIGDSQELGQWAIARVQHLTLGTTPYTAVGLRNAEGKILAAVIYENFIRGCSIDVHIAIAGRMTPFFLGEIFRYPFMTLGVHRLTAKIAAGNVRSCRFVEHLGFTLEGRVREQLPGLEDLLVYGMLKSECRWLGVKLHGRELQHGTAAATLPGGSECTAAGPAVAATAADRRAAYVATAADHAATRRRLQ
jgi:hypothetical protein